MSKSSSKAKNIEEIASSTLLETVENNIKQNKKNGNKECNSAKCKYAKMFQQKGSAYTTFIEGDPVYVLKKPDGKYVAYGLCSFAHIHGSDFCKRHEKQASEKRILIETLVSSAEQIKSIKHPYFDGMGTRGARKKVDEGDVYKFPCTDHPILKLLRDPNKNYTLWLVQCAVAIRESGKPIITSNGSTTYTIQQKMVETQSASSMFNLMNEDEDDNGKSKEVPKKKSKPAVIEVEEEAETEDEDDAKSEDSSDTVSVSDSEDAKSDTEDEDEEEMSVVPIETNKGQKYFMNPETQKVYEIPSDEEDDNNPIETGTLIEIVKKYSTVTYDDKYHIIAKEISDKDKNLDMYLCVCTDRVFDTTTKACLGKLKRGKNGISIQYREDK